MLTVPAVNHTGDVVIEWSVSALAISYALEQSSDAGSTWTSVYEGDATQAALTDLDDGTYRYRVKACNTYGCSAWRVAPGVLVVTRPPTEAPVLSVPSTNTTGAYQVSWSPVARATTYELQEKMPSNPIWETVQDDTNQSWSATAEGDGDHAYRVRGSNAVGTGPWSDTATVHVVLAPPPQPTLTVDTPISHDGTYTLTWGGTGSSASFVLLEQANGGPWQTVLSGAEASAVMTGKPDGTYVYKLQACDARACSPWSNSVTVSVDVGLGVPENISAQKLTPMGVTTIAITWTGQSAATLYHVEMTRNGVVSTPYSGSGTSASIRIGASDQVKFRVNACDASECSPWSAYVYPEGSPASL
jgi:hypothetical protein